MENRRFPNILIGTFVALLAYGSVFPVAAQSDDRKDTVRVLILKNFPPQFVSIPEGPTGLAIEMIREVAQRVSLKIDFVTVDTWGEIYASLENGTVDVMPNMGVSEARRKFVEFTNPYEVFDIKLFVRKETTDIKVFDDLKSRLLGIQSTNVLSKGLVESGKYTIKSYPSYQAAFLGLLSGEIDAVPAPTEPFQLIARAAHLDGRIQPVGSSLLEVKRAMALPKGRIELRDLLNKGL